MPGALEPTLGRGTERLAAVHLVLQPFEEHDVGVDGDTDGDDDAGDAGEREREAARLREQADDAPHQCRRDDEPGGADPRQRPVVEEHEQQDEADADQAGHDAGPERVLAERRRHGLHRLRLHLDRGRAVLQDLRQVGRLGFREAADAAADEHLVAVEEAGLRHWRRDDAMVEHDRHAARGALGGTIEAPSRPVVPGIQPERTALELELDLPLAVHEARRGRRDGRFAERERRSHLEDLGALAIREHHGRLGQVILVRRDDRRQVGHRWCGGGATGDRRGRARHRGDRRSW